MNDAEAIKLFGKEFVEYIQYLRKEFKAKKVLIHEKESLPHRWRNVKEQKAEIKD